MVICRGSKGKRFMSLWDTLGVLKSGTPSGKWAPPSALVLGALHS